MVEKILLNDVDVNGKFCTTQVKGTPVVFINIARKDSWGLTGTVVL